MSKQISKVPLKNYMILLVMAVITVLLTFYINAWIKAYKEDKISVSPFDGIVEEVNISDLELSLSEMNEVVIYVGYTNDKKIHDMEKRLLKYIKKHEIVDKFIYLNVTDELESEKYIKSLKKIFSSVKEDIEKAPMLIYVKNGIAVEVIKSKNGMLYTYDVQSLNEEYGLE